MVENLIRADVHPLEEAQGFHALLMLEEPKYSIEQIGAKVGKPPAYIAARTRLTELTALAVTAFYAEEIGVGHALLLAKLQPAQQEQALTNCFREEWNGGAGRKAKRILLPMRHLHQWIEQNVLLFLKQAPFNKRDAQLVPAAGTCVECPKRTGNNNSCLPSFQRARRNAPIQPATPSSWRRTYKSYSPRNRDWYRSAPPTVDKRRAARSLPAISTLRFGRTKPSLPNRRSGLSSRRASTPRKPSLPKGWRRAKFDRFPVACGHPSS